jgi:hypothetical protein
MGMLEDQGVPKVTAHLRSSKLSKLPHYKDGVIEHKDQHNLSKNAFPMKRDGYPMGTVPISNTQGKKPSKCISQMECPCMQTFCFLKCLAALYAL